MGPGTGTSPGTDSGPGPGSGTDTERGSGTGTGTDPGPGPGTGTDTERGSGTGTGTDPGTDPGPGPGPGPGTGTDPETGSGTGSGTGAGLTPRTGARMGGEPDNLTDGRVLCWYCKHWTHHKRIEHRQRLDDGSMRTVELRVRCCELVGEDLNVLGYDPLIPRWCLEYEALPPAYRPRLPDGAFPRGWKPLSDDK